MSNDSRGWVRLWRKSLDSAVWADPDLWRTWCTCLLLANHAPADVLIPGMLQTVHVEPGQFITGRFEFFKALFPTRRRSNPHPQTAWRWLEALQSVGNLHIKTHNRFSVITVTNWRVYQPTDIQNAPANAPAMHSSCTRDAHEQELQNVKKQPSPAVRGAGKSEKANVWREYVDAWRASGRKPDPVRAGPDVGASKELSKLIPDHVERRRVLTAFLADHDAFLLRNGHSLRLLSGKLNSYMLRATASTPGSRPASDEIERRERLLKGEEVAT